MRISTFPFVLLLLALMTAVPVRGQDAYRLDPGSRLWVEGTSNKSDWTVHAKALNGTVRLGTANAIDGVTLTVPADQILSDKSAIMDRLMHNALQVAEHPSIAYELVSATVEPAAGDAFTVQTQGRLTIAGETRTITFPVTGERLANGQVRFRGSHPVKMTDYGLKPPVAMFGALRTADDVTVHFDLVAAPE